ncbi:MAG: type II toxin-antitoxin system VapC family toxin [Lautropia sp.]|nr:type II toxin-antitoxin system VapC family toxin [Lautropia sp.]
MKTAVDTNVLLRYLLADEPQQAEIARTLVHEADLLIVPLPVLCEVVWVLRQGYKLTPAAIADALDILIGADNVQTSRAAVETGLAMLRAGGDFADGVIAHDAKTLGARRFATFDKKSANLLNRLNVIPAQLLR